MARINIEDDLYRDRRFMDLCMALGNLDAAIGCLVRAWSLAQRWYLTDDRMIPIAEWEKQLLPNSLFECNLAERVGDKVRVRGADDQFHWLIQRSDAGRRSAEAKKEINNQRPLTAEQRPSNVRQRLATSSSFSFSVSNTNTKNLKTAPQSVAVPADNPIGRFVGTYVKAFQSKYGEGTRPDLSGKVQGEIKRFLKDTPIDRACSLIQVYLQMDDRWFETKHHDFTTFAQNVSKIGVALDTGRSPGGLNWGEFWKAQGQ